MRSPRRSASAEDDHRAAPRSSDQFPGDQRALLGLQRTIGNTAVTRLLAAASVNIRRKIELQEATVETRPKNPAEQFASGESLAQLELGFTKLKVNDGDHRLYSFDSPKPEVADLKGDYIPKHPPIETEVETMFGVETESEPHPEDVEAEKTHESDRYAGWLNTTPRNRFSWVITVPPAEPWAAKDVPTATLKRLVEEVKGSGGSGDGPDSVTKPGNLRVFSPAGNIVDHTLVHERQHVEDHIDVIEAQVRPWDVLAEKHQSRETALKGPSGGEVSSSLKPPMFFAHHVEKSGEDFHKQEAGKLPSLAVAVDAETGAVEVKATPIKVMTDVTPGHYIPRS